MEDTITNESSKATMANAPNRTFKIQSTGVENLVTELETLNSKGAVKKKSSSHIKAKHEPNPTLENSPCERSSKNKNKKYPKNKSKDFISSETSKYKDSGKFANSSSSDAYSDISSKLNSFGNMRSTKQSKSSVPNHYVELHDVSNIAEASTPKNSDRKNSRYRSKTPDFKTTPTKPRQQINKANSSKRGLKFEPYIPLFQVQQGLKRGEFIEGALRINPRNYEDAYVSSPDGKMDIYIGGMQDRNRALAGDIVVVQINPKQEWKVLCDAIKDYEEKSGEIIADTVCMPIPSPPCKVHTPDKLLKSSRPQSSNSWGSNFEEHGPDTLKILGIDKLAKQLGVFSIDQKKSPKQRSKPKSKLCKPSKENEGQSGASYSQESSEDCLDKMSPNLEHTSHEQTNFKQASNLNPLTSENYNDLSSLTTECTDAMYPACDMNKIGMFNLEVEKDSNTSKAWEGEESSLSIIISPEELLNIDGNSLLQHNVIYDNEGSDSEFNGIIVPPGDLSGDEFTDSASVGSTQSQHLEQILEDSAFLACQQDADNNNVVLSNNVTDVLIDQFNNIDLQGLASKSSVTSTERYLERDCRVQHVNSFPSLQPVEINSESVVCSVISEVQLSKIGSSSDENVDADPLIIGHFNDLSKNINEQVTTTENKKKSKHRRRKKKQDKKEVVKSNANEKSIGVGNLTVDEIMKHPKWSNFIQRTGKIVHILERKHSRIAAGHLKIFPDKNTNWALFSPNDSRVPRIMVPMSDCPENFYHRSQDYANVLFLAEIVDWNETSTFAAGKLLKCLGNTGDVEVETEGILLENSVEFGEFPNEVLDCLPQEKEWHVPLQEIKTRKDFRNQCIFTIDPATARDMDDAVSCTFLQNGNFEVGVHIADVTYFVEEGSELDLFAKDRSTSVYLVQKVVPMLPRLLCDNLCSLNPGQDRLTFSIVWEMTPQGDICKQWIGRSIIKSCSKLSYEHAQSMLENPGLEHWNVSEFPEVYGGFTINDIAISVYHLHCLALQLRERRFNNGALRLDQVKLQFTLDAESGLPSGFNVFVHKDSNKLIEEFMLLANMCVARHIYETFPTLSLLRRHPPPQPKMLTDIVSMCETMGVILDPSSSSTLQSSIAQYKGDDYLSKARTELLMNLISKPMNCALYFCTGVLEEPSMFCHYALNVPLYTHFTSPIRRYPDIIVHRLLGASLKYNALPNLRSEEIEKCAVHCNDKKYNAKKVSDQSAEIFLAAFIRKMGSVHAKAMVLGVMDHSFDCLVLDMGVIKRVYCDKLPLLKKQFKRSQGVNQLNIFWKDPSLQGGLEQVIVIFALVDVILTSDKESLQIRVTLKKPEL